MTDLNRYAFTADVRFPDGAETVQLRKAAGREHADLDGYLFNGEQHAIDWRKQTRGACYTFHRVRLIRCGSCVCEAQIYSVEDMGVMEALTDD